MGNSHRSTKPAAPVLGKQSSSSSLSSDPIFHDEHTDLSEIRTGWNGWNFSRRIAMLMRAGIVGCRSWYLRKILKMDLHPDVQISLKAYLDLTNPRGVHIEQGTYIALYAIVLAHDMTRVLHTDTYIGRNCFIGARAIVMPGVRIGDQCIVGSGSVVTRDVPSHSIVAGNPAKVVRSGIQTVKWGILENAYREALASEPKA